MFKRLFPALIIVAFLIPHQQTLANESNMYYNEEYKYSITFPDHWYMFSEEMKQNLTPEERENSPAIFIRGDGSSQMFIRHLEQENKKFELYKNVIEYVQKTPEEKQKIKRVLNPISTELGRTITNYDIDELNETIELQLTQSSPQFGEIYTTIFWKEFKGTLIELEFYHFENDSILTNESSMINSSFTISPDSLDSSIKEGSMDLLNNKSLSGIDQNDTFISKTVDFVTKPIVWISAISLILISLLAKLIYKLI